MKKGALLFMAVCVFAGITSFVSAGESMSPLALAKGKLGVGLSLGYGSADKFYDADGEAQDIGGTISTMPIDLSAAYGIIDNLEAGVNISLVRDAVSPDEGDAVSGFGLRNVIIGAKYAVIPELAVGAGFLLDVGTSEDELEAADEYPTSDGFHGIAINLAGKKAFDKIVLNGGIRYTLLLGRDIDMSTGAGTITVDVNPGDILDLSVGGGYQILDNLYAGLDIMFAKQIGDTEIEAGGVTQTEEAVFQVLSVGVNAVYDINDTISVFLNLKENSEYFPIGVPLMGKEAPATGIPPVTIGVKATLL